MQAPPSCPSSPRQAKAGLAEPVDTCQAHHIILLQTILHAQPRIEEAELAKLGSCIQNAGTAWHPCVMGTLQEPCLALQASLASR